MTEQEPPLNALTFPGGVGARNIRNIVLLRPVRTMIEFKQIIGRGTRLFDGKDYFTVYDFERAHEHFQDPEWDGDPLPPEEGDPRTPASPDDIPAPPDPGDFPEEPEEEGPGEMIQVRLADGRYREIQHMMATSFWSPDGTPISAQQFIERLFGELPELCADEDELRRIWSEPESRIRLLTTLEERGYGPAELNEIRHLINAERSDVFDVLAYIAYALKPLTRDERAEMAGTAIASSYEEPVQVFLDFVLSHYRNEGVGELDPAKLPDLLELKYGGTREAVEELGDPDAIGSAFRNFQRHLYAERVST